MNTTVWKYPLRVVADHRVGLPAGAELLTVQLQNGVPTLWALVDPNEQRREARRIRGVLTGDEPATDLGRYLGTVQLRGGEFVLHYFEAVR